jgi:hypothetical protein
LDDAVGVQARMVQLRVERSTLAVGLSRYLLPGRPLGEKRDRSRLLRGAPERAPNSSRRAGFPSRRSLSRALHHIFHAPFGGPSAPLRKGVPASEIVLLAVTLAQRVRRRGLSFEQRLSANRRQRIGGRRNALSQTATGGDRSSVQASRRGSVTEPNRPAPGTGEVHHDAAVVRSFCGRAD